MATHWNAFTPWSSLAGGALIGLATAMFVLLNGRIGGISGGSRGCSGRPRGMLPGEPLSSADCLRLP